MDRARRSERRSVGGSSPSSPAMKVEQAVEILNKIFRADPIAMQDIIDHRMEINLDEEHVKDVNLIIGTGKDGEGPDTIGPLGIMQALITGGRVAASYNDDGKLTGFGIWEGLG